MKVNIKKNIEISTRLIDKDEEEKLEKCFKDIEDGNVYTFDVVYNKAKEVLKR